jgi:MrfA Zn-binding domain
MSFIKYQLRRSQAVTTFGPGAIVDLSELSVMMAGINRWPQEPVQWVHEPNLEALLRVDGFHTPVTIESADERSTLPATIFPKWVRCTKCNRIAHYSYFLQGKSMQKNGVIRCPDPKCRRARVIPARLVVACEKGHIQDFPWVEWAHKKSGTVCENPAIVLFSAGRTAALGDMIVKCKTCGLSASLSSATRKEEIAKLVQCAGHRPWLQDQVTCNQPLIPLQRGASNVYFSSILSSISIPPWSSSINSMLNNYWITLKHVPEDALELVIRGMNLPEALGRDIDEIVAVAIERKRLEETGEKKLTERQLRYKECDALRYPERSARREKSDFDASKGHIDEFLKPWISRITLVDRLREVRALKGFTRISPPGPDQETEQGSKLSPLSSHRLNWLPAIEVFGEGIYVELNEEKVNSWISNFPKMKHRAETIQKSYEKFCENFDWPVTRIITPKYLLCHSLAHVLIKQLGLESGYSSASIRERIYVFEKNEKGIDSNPGITGFLLYTSTPDSDGSLGGLVRQGKPDNFTLVLRQGLNEAAWCSSDPLCIESIGQGFGKMNLAACHSCLLLPETCCEEFNRMLDRASLIGTIDDANSGFFSDLLG